MYNVVVKRECKKAEHGQYTQQSGGRVTHTKSKKNKQTEKLIFHLMGIIFTLDMSAHRTTKYERRVNFFARALALTHVIVCSRVYYHVKFSFRQSTSVSEFDQ